MIRNQLYLINATVSDYMLEAKKVILIELTVPWEDGCIEASEHKNTKYQDLV